LEEEFALTYSMKGMDWFAIQDMLSKERLWHLRRLRDQLKKENAEIKRTTPKKKR
jgi:hypothetical protein